MQIFEKSDGADPLRPNRKGKDPTVFVWGLVVGGFGRSIRSSEGDHGADGWPPWWGWLGVVSGAPI